MMGNRRVTCKICGKKIMSEDAYHIVDSQGANLYYCSKEEYDKYKSLKAKLKQQRDDIYFILCDILGKSEIKDTHFYHEWKEWTSIGGDAKLLKFLIQYKKEIKEAISNPKLNIASFTSKILYVSAIIKNNIKSFNPVEPVTKSVEDFDLILIQEINKPKTKKRSLSDIEDDCDGE